MDRTTTSQSQVNHIGSDGASNPMESSTGRMEFENVSNTKPDNARMGLGSLVHEKDSDETLEISMSSFPLLPQSYPKHKANQPCRVSINLWPRRGVGATSVDDPNRRPSPSDEVALFEYEPLQEINNVSDAVKVEVALDSGSVAHTTQPSNMPKATTITPNASGRHFTGAGGDVIERHGSATTKMTGTKGSVACNWELADVTRSLNSVSLICGAEQGPGKADVLFTNKKGVVVPPGAVEEILQKYKPIAEYSRKGGLYIAEMTLSGFTRQGQGA